MNSSTRTLSVALIEDNLSQNLIIVSAVHFHSQIIGLAIHKASTIKKHLRGVSHRKNFCEKTRVELCGEGKLHFMEAFQDSDIQFCSY